MILTGKDAIQGTLVLMLQRGNIFVFLIVMMKYLENHLEVLYNRIQNEKEPKALFYVSSLHDVNNGPVENRVTPEFDYKYKFGFIMKYTFNPTSVAVHFEILKEYKFDSILYCLEDFDLWLHVALKYHIIKLPERTILLHFHEDSFTDGDYYRFTKELRNFKYVFNKEEFKHVLPQKSKNRLLSMCYYKLAVRYENENKIYNMYKSIIKSYFLYPKGYNNRTNKPILVMFLYHIPVLGKFIKTFARLF